MTLRRSRPWIQPRKLPYFILTAKCKVISDESKKTQLQDITRAFTILNTSWIANMQYFTQFLR